MKFLSAFVDISVDDSKLKTQLAKARSAVTKTVDKIKSSFKKMGASFKAVFSKMVKYAKYAMTAIALASTKAFASFDDAMQKSVAIMSGMTVELRKELEKTALSISKNSVKSATELARSYFYLASAGLSVKQSLKALSVVEAFAVAGAFDMALATDLITDAQSALGLTVKDSIKNMQNMKRVSDVLIGANTLANASTQQFSEALMRAGPAMKAYGIELEEGTAILAAYADQGKKAAEGGEMFGRMLRLMIKGFIDNEAAWRGFEISIEDTNGKMRPLADIVRDLTGLLDGMGVTQKARTLEMLGFQARSQQTILPLLGMGDAIERYNEKLKDMGEITQRVRDFQLKSFASQMKIVWNNIVSIGIAIGKKLAPHIEVLGNMLRDNRDIIEKWAIAFVDYILLAKDSVFAFLSIFKSEGGWKAGIKAGLDISLELFKGFGKSLIVIMKDIASQAWRAFAKDFGEGLGKWLVQASQPKGIIGKALGLTPVGMAARLGMMKGGMGLIKEARGAQQTEGPSLSEKLKGVWAETAAAIKEIVPDLPEDTFKDIEDKLEAIKTAAEEIKKPMEKTLVDIPERSSEAMRKLSEKMTSWADSASDIWNNLGDVATGALDRTADALTNLVVKGKADWKSLAQSIIMDITRVMIKQQMAQVVGGFFGGGAVAGLQFGGEVKKTGLAVVHKGETFSGVNGENVKQEAVTLNMNVSAIDAAGVHQFLNKNKRAIAATMKGMLDANHPIRRVKTGWK